jgi:hypothetical protein
MRPGLKTTAFWLVIAYLILSTSILAGVLSQVDASYLEGVLTHAAGLIVKLVADPVVICFYIRSRALPKEVEADDRDYPRVSYGTWPDGEEPPF